VSLDNQALKLQLCGFHTDALFTSSIVQKAEVLSGSGNFGGFKSYICPMFDQIHAHISRYVTLSGEELALLDSLLIPHQVPKKTILLKEGDLCNFESYINKGCIRTYYLDESGQEVTLQFAIEDWWVSDIASFHDHTPSNMFIETLEDCELLTLNPATKEHLLTHIPQLERMFRIMVQRNLSVLQSRLFKTIANSAKDKYQDFIERYPTIPQRVAQHYIASYLGISAEFLSKVRSRIAKRPE
jgi:CRP/FNR family transcriptional regulator, cyclic AMP receptor protein